MIARIGAVLTLLLLTSCGASDPDATSSLPPITRTEAPASGPVKVSLGEWLVLPSPDEVEAGDVTFEVSNDGEDPHEFVIASSDLDPGELPTAADGSVDEEEVEIVDEIEELKSGDEDELDVDLEAGDYVLFCNLVEEEDGETEVHYKLGMRTGFSVS